MCDNARETCPVFFGAAERLHHSFEDPPASGIGSELERMAIFRRVRDELLLWLSEFAGGVKFARMSRPPGSTQRPHAA